MWHAFVLALVLTPSWAASAALSIQADGAETEQASILAVVDRFMHAVSSNDVGSLAALRLDDAINTSARPDGKGGTLVTRRAFDASTFKPGAYRERYWDPVVHVRGSIAVVWTSYEFWVEGKTSHCGVDVFEMIKQDGRWRIGNLMWTIESVDVCERLRPSDPSRIRPTRN
jgi:hypothetical protein